MAGILRNRWKKVRHYLGQRIPVLSNIKRKIAEGVNRTKRLEELYQNLVSTLLKQRDLIGPKRTIPSPPVEPLENQDYLAEGLARIRKLAPHAYAAWELCQKTGEVAYQKEPESSCSIQGRECVERFRAFISPYLAGRVLDIGCGPVAVPDYLSDYPLPLIAGIDPIEASHPFVFCKGIAEYLPWPDATFDTIVNATSLDHTILLDQALAEIKRVMKPDGYCLLWVGFIPGSPKYDPYASEVKPVDAFHLFHFDRHWFEQLIQNTFSICEAFEIYCPRTLTVAESYYALKPLNRAT